MRVDHSDKHPPAECDPWIAAVKENPFVYVVIAMCLILVVSGFILNIVPMWACGIVALVPSCAIACCYACSVR